MVGPDADVPANVPTDGRPAEDWDDATLVGRSTDGDDLAFAVLVRRYQAPLYRHAWRLTQDRRTAEDVTQEAFVTAWRRLPGLARPESFRSWLYQIATRRSIDAVRARRPEQPLDPTGSVGAAQSLAAAEPGPADAVERREQLQDLASALQELPLGQRAAWSMREIDGLSYDEIATALVLPVSTVRGRIARARRDLAERMSAWQTTRD
jgi:RNA polymerase sigma-70 factor (ECF subfamily)